MNRALASLARALCDTEEFRSAIERAVDEYGFWYRRHTERRPARTRAALREFDRLSGELVGWLTAALGTDEAPESRAARALHTAGLERGMLARSALERLQGDLLELSTLRPRAAEFLTGDKAPKAAPRLLADSLWTLLPRHGIPCTVYDAGPAARLLVAIARAAGDRITPAAAKKALAQTQPRSHGSERKKARNRS